MSRLRARFEELRARGEGTLVAYLTAGYPDPSAAPEMLAALAEGGADIIELGIPFSDPTADGPTIQAACTQALDNGFKVDSAFASVRGFRAEYDVPLILFTYLNPVLARGPERFAAEAAEAGADGLLIVDCPPEESEELDEVLHRHGLVRIYLIAPTTGRERAAAILERAEGFVYVITATGTTGKDDAVAADVSGLLGMVRELTGSPVVAGFGIARPDQVAGICALCDGAVVGSELVRAAAAGSAGELRERVAGLKAATRRR